MAAVWCGRISRRMFSAVPQTGGAQVSRLSNGVTVVSHDHGEPVSTVSIYAAAGSRNETAQTAGATLHLKALPYQSTTNRTNVYVAREAEAHGFKLLSCAGRENIGYHVHFLRQQLSTAVDSLVDIVTAPAFYDWEVRDNAKSVSEEVDKVQGDSHTLLLQDAHRGLFRNTLGPSLYNKNHQEQTPETLKAYYSQHFVGERVAVVGTGVPHSELVQAVQNLSKLPAKGASTTPAKYFGGAEILVESPVDKVHAAFVFPGASHSQGDAAAFNILRFLLGGAGSSIKYSDGASSSKVAGAVAASQSSGFSLQTVHTQYSDAGLLAVVLTTSPPAAAAHITAAAGAVRNTLQNFTEADIKRAKNQLVFNLLSLERGLYVSHAAGEALATHKHTSSQEKLAAIEKATPNDIKAAASRLLNTQPVYVARGNINNVPYLDQLFK